MDFHEARLFPQPVYYCNEELAAITLLVSEIRCTEAYIQYLFNTLYILSQRNVNNPKKITLSHHSRISHIRNSIILS